MLQEGANYIVSFHEGEQNPDLLWFKGQNKNILQVLMV